MTKINPILDAMSAIDDNIVTNTKKTKKRPLLIAAAVAAAAVLLMGCVQAYRSSVKIGGKFAYDVDYHVQEDLVLLTHEELTKMGAELISENAPGATGRYYRLTALPSEIFSAFNLKLLINDNFTEEPCDMGIDYIWVTNYPSELKVLDMSYYLTDKESGNRVKFFIDLPLTEQYAPERYFNEDYFDKYTYLDLNDGSKALISDSHSVYFAYGGISYDLYLEDAADIDGVKQILADLGVL